MNHSFLCYISAGSSFCENGYRWTKRDANIAGNCSILIGPSTGRYSNVVRRRRIDSLLTNCLNNKSVDVLRKLIRSNVEFVFVLPNS